ncbi:Crp/Fnr family transcriptional regulator [Candidatus Poribacteria bacterium]|nr:Crp/Fnr family transcriptional regulator [Candidatus Poribacteria bacterium]
MVTQQKIPERFWCVKQIDIFRDLVSEADADALARITTFVQLKHGDTLSAEGVYLLKEGHIKIYQTPPEGEAITLDVLEPGEFFGAVKWEDNDAASNVTAETFAETSVVGVVSVQNFQYFLKRKPHLAMPPQRTLGSLLKRYLRQRSAEPANYNIVTTCQKQRRGLTNPFLNIAFRSPASRLALLLQNCAEAPEHRRTAMGRNARCVGRKLSTRRLAQLIGISVEKMETLLNQFKHHQIIKKRFRQIQILDPWQLKKIANARMETLPPLQTQSDSNFLPDTQPATSAQADLRNAVDS